MLSPSAHPPPPLFPEAPSSVTGNFLSPRSFTSALSFPHFLLSALEKGDQLVVRLTCVPFVSLEESDRFKA